MAAYATISDLIARRDKRTIGELMQDSDEPPTDAEILANANLTAILGDASGQVEAAMLCGKRYLPTDLEGLTGNSLSLLKKVVCTIAMADLYERRPGYHIEQATAYAQQAKAYLEDLRTGKNLFNLTDLSAANAAIPSTEGPTSIEYTNLNLLPEQMIRHFPNRVTRLPIGR
jgi:phage gp36-like protein